MLKIVYWFYLIGVVLYASVCSDAFKAVDKEVKQYTRIIDHIEEYHSSCNVVYAYSIFLHNPTEMDLLEKDNAYGEQLGKFVKEYPYISKLIVNKKTYKFFKYYYSIQKQAIDYSIKQSFSLNELQNKNNLVYVQMALQIIGDDVNKEILTKQIKDLKRRYSLDDMKVVLEFWAVVKQKYKNSYRDNKTLFAKLEQALDIYTLRTLKKYALYGADFYPVLLPRKIQAKNYMKTMKYLMNTLNINQTSIAQQAFFLKNISLDIEIALADGHTNEEVIQYFKVFIQKQFIHQFGELRSCMEKQGLAMVVSDHLDAKLKWKKEDKQLFYKIIKELKRVKGKKEKLNILGLYNYASSVYGRMNLDNQKEMFNSIVNLPTQNIIFNLSLVYGLGKNTSYFSSIINNPNRLYRNKAYVNMLYDVRDNVMMLDLYRKLTTRKEFYEKIDFLVNNPDEIGEMTTGEKIEFVVNTVDYISYATMITGVGLVTNLAKVLVVNGIKGEVKQGIKQAGKLMLAELKTMKGQAVRQWERFAVDLDKASEVLPRSKIWELSKLSYAKAPNAVKRELAKMNLSEAQKDAVYLRIAIYQGKLSKKEASILFKNLGGTKGFREGLSKVIGNSTVKTRGHLNELRIANYASERGFDVVEIGKRFNDGIKRGDSDIDILLRKNGQDIVIEAKQYAKTTKMPLDKFRGDLDTLIAYEKSHPDRKVLKTFTFTKKPKSKKLLRQYQFWAKKKGVNLIFGTPKQQIDEIAKLTQQGVSEMMVSSMFIAVPAIYGVYRYFYTTEQKQLCER